MAAPGYSLETSATSGVSGTTNNGFDNSGWTVNFGGAGGVTTSQNTGTLWLIAGGLAVVALLLLKRRK